ncbi:MAG: helix-turn-helix domain-containing protein [Alphaproteobacteria bacterium]|nr:helix-turn-helix domain-containing protein [Alphaproteobacteria bacterium]
MSALREMRRRKGLSMEALARLTDTTASQINKLEKRQRRLTDDWLRKLARALACNPNDLIDDFIPAQPELGAPKHVFIPECGLSEIDETGPAAGVGHFLDYTVFRADWLKAISNVPCDKLLVYRVDDDSMEPTFRSGDHVLVEPTSDRIRGDGIYVMIVRSGLVIKRVVFSPEGNYVSVHSDNPVYPSHERVSRTSISLVGRVIWVGKRI